MNALWGLMILTGILYGCFVDATFWKLYGLVVLLYTIFVNLQKNKRDNHRRKTLLISTWGGKYSQTGLFNDHVTCFFRAKRSHIVHL